MLGRAKEGAGVGSPEGCFTITVRRHGARMYICVCFCVKKPDSRGEETTKRCSEGTAVRIRPSEYGGLILGADGTPAVVPVIAEPGGAAQGLHVCVHLQGVDLPGGEGGSRA